MHRLHACKNARVRQRLAAHPPGEIRLSPVVLGELYLGALRSARLDANRKKIDRFAAPYLVLPFDLATAEVYSVIRHTLERQGTPIGPYDLQIAATALTHNCILVTHNLAEFSRVPGLTIEDWEAP
jgi:tRNA(fMet)-specific endonuclease VapC